MADKAKFLSTILIGLMVLSLGLAGVLFIALQKEEATRASLQNELNTVTAAKKAAELKMEESKKKVAELENKIIDNNNQIDFLNKELQEQKTEKEDALARMLQLKETIDQHKTLRSILEEKVVVAQDSTKKMQEELNKLQSQKAELEDKIKELEKNSDYVELGKIVVTPESSSVFGTPVPETVAAEEEYNAAVQEPAVSKTGSKEQAASSVKPAEEKTKKARASSGLDGKVLVVNRDYNFVVVNLGSKDGVVVGNEFAIYHNDKYIGDVKVEKVHDSMAAAGFVSNDIKNQISEGDKAVRKK